MPRTAGRAGDGIPVTEWVAAALGLLVVLGSVGFLLVEAARGPDGPPDVVVTVEAVSRVETGYLVEFSAVNRGGEAAEGVTVRGELRSEAGTVAVSEARLEFVPVGSTRRGGLYFPEDPRRFRLELRAEGYVTP